jgi:hypothetical protein
LIHAASSGEKNANGLLQRFLCAVWPTATTAASSTPRDEEAAARVDDDGQARDAQRGGLRRCFDGKFRYIGLTPKLRSFSRSGKTALTRSWQKTGALASHSKFKAGWLGALGTW